MGLRDQCLTLIRAFESESDRALRRPVMPNISMRKRVGSDSAPKMSVTVTQVAGGNKIRVTTRDEHSRDIIPGACYGLVKGNSTHIAAECDTDGNGVIELDGLAAGTYTLVQTWVPHPNYGAQVQKVTIGTTTVYVVIKNSIDP